MTRQIKALLVEDTEDDAELTLRALRAGGLAVAWRRVETDVAMAAALRDEPWDVILADYALPQFDAPHALALLKASGLDIPFIIVSGMVGEEDAVAVMRAGAADYVMKDKLARLAPAVERELAEAAIRAERRRSLDDLVASEERFRMMADSAPVYLWLADTTGSRTFFNKGWLDFTGRAMAAEMGSGWVDGVHADERAACLHAYANAVSSGSSLQLEYRLRRADGAYRWIMDHGRPLFRPDGKLNGFIGSCIDFTERKAAEEIREHLLVEEKRVSRLKDEFLATMSHELRTPMNAILGWSELLVSGDTDPSELPLAFETINRNAKAQTKLISDLLEMSRIITGKIALDVRPVDLAAVAKSACDSLALSAAAKGVALQLTLDRSLGYVAGDGNRLQQVAWNLLSNALKFTPQGGHVDVELDRVGANARFRVKDTGEGIDPSFLPYVFDRFQQADGSITRRHGGLGLGLAIVRHVTELHGGTVAVASAGKGKGAAFTVLLPLIAESVGDGFRPGENGDKALLSNAGEMTKQHLAGARILIVDDQPDAISLAQHVLKRSGAEVLAATSVQHAIAILRQRSIDVLVSDIGMPGNTGLDLIKELRTWLPEQGGQIPAAALTAHARDEDRLEAVRAGFDAHLAKPIEPALLVATVARLLGRPRGGLVVAQDEVQSLG